MPSGSQDQQHKHSAADNQLNGEIPVPLTSEEVKAGYQAPTTHAQRQAFLQNSRLGKLLGIPQVTPKSEESSQSA